MKKDTHAKATLVELDGGLLLTRQTLPPTSTDLMQPIEDTEAPGAALKEALSRIAEDFGWVVTITIDRPA